MIFRELKLTNFGIYNGEHIINLVTDSNNRTKSIILIGALNGSGKTTILDAIQLALYGNSAVQSSRLNGAYPAYLESLINSESNPKEVTGIQLTIQIQKHQKTEVIRINRNWKKNKKGISELFNVKVNGELDTFSTNNWDDVVEEIIPKGIAHLFFFDGEKIEKLASPNEAAKIIETGLNSLLGLDLVDRLKSDLEIIERKRKRNLFKKEDKIKVNKIESELKEQQEETSKIYQKMAILKNKIDRLLKEKNELDAKYIKIGGELYDTQSDIRKNKELHEKDLKELKNQANIFLSKSAPLILVNDLLKQAIEKSEMEDSLKKFKLLSDKIEDRDKKLIDHLKKNQVDSNVIKSINKYLRDDRKKHNEKKEDILFLEIEKRIFSKITKEYLNNISSESVDILNKSNEISQKIYHANQKLNAVPEKEQVASIISKLNKNESKLSLLYQEKEKLEKSYNIYRELLNRKQIELEKAFELNIENELIQEKAERVLLHIGKVKNTLSIFRCQVAEKHLYMLERMILDSFVQLIRKPNFVVSIKIEPLTFNLKLFDKKNNEMEASKLSAGERQLLSISILWGLAKTSGRPLPTIIDTPLGRLDTKHRENLIKYYFSNASHQVILLSTDTEIDQNYYKKLRSKINKTYKINFDEKLKSSIIEQGYFK